MQNWSKQAWICVLVCTGPVPWFFLLWSKCGPDQSYIILWILSAPASTVQLSPRLFSQFSGEHHQLTEMGQQHNHNEKKPDCSSYATSEMCSPSPSQYGFFLPLSSARFVPSAEWAINCKFPIIEYLDTWKYLLLRQNIGATSFLSNFHVTQSTAPQF